MMKQNNIILFDVPAVRDNLLPLSYTRLVADFLVGITTLRKKWEAFIDGVFSYFTRLTFLKNSPWSRLKRISSSHRMLLPHAAWRRRCSRLHRGMPGGRHRAGSVC